MGDKSTYELNKILENANIVVIVLHLLYKGY